jgi:protein gp37
MGETTSISWTDATFNPWWGCTKVSPGCDHCYAETFDKRVGGDHWGAGKPRRTLSDNYWREPLKWNAKAANDGVMRKVFCASMADIFDEEAPEGQLSRLWELMDKTQNLIWQLLTKRPNGYLSKLPARFADSPRVWKGVTTEDQERYMLRWPLMQRLSGICWISYEPAIGPLQLTALKPPYPRWVVFGGESGHWYRRAEVVWAEGVLAECRQWGSAFFAKQMSALTPSTGKASIPSHLRIQEFPEVRGMGCTW